MLVDHRDDRVQLADERRSTVSEERFELRVSPNDDVAVSNKTLPSALYLLLRTARELGITYLSEGGRIVSTLFARDGREVVGLTAPNCDLLLDRPLDDTPSRR